MVQANAAHACADSIVLCAGVSPVALSCCAPETSAAEGLQGLQARINKLRDTQGPAAAGVGSSSSSWSSPGSLGQQIPGSRGASDPDFGSQGDATGSFSDAEDSEVSAALSKRIKQIATTTGEWGSSMDEEEMPQPLSGEVSSASGAFLVTFSTDCVVCAAVHVPCLHPSGETMVVMLVVIRGSRAPTMILTTPGGDLYAPSMACTKQLSLQLPSKPC
jgi:hypothetical protein